MYQEHSKEKFFLLSKYKTALRADLGPKLGNFENKSINSFNEDDVILKW